MVTKKSLATKAATGFGVAMAAMYAAPELQADIVDLTFTPSYVPASGVTTINFNEVSGFSVQGWDTSTFLSGASGGYLDSIGGSGIALANVGDSVNAGFTAGFRIYLTAAMSGVQYAAFGANGNAGWFAFDMGPAGVGQGIAFVDGEYGSMGETVTVGGTTVIPEPTGLGGLAALALGAMGVRRNRKK